MKHQTRTIQTAYALLQYFSIVCTDSKTASLEAAKELGSCSIFSAVVSRPWVCVKTQTTWSFLHTALGWSQKTLCH